jgi:hypothetical protein
MVSFGICRQPFSPNGENDIEQAGRNHFEDMLAMVGFGWEACCGNHIADVGNMVKHWQKSILGRA